MVRPWPLLWSLTKGVGQFLPRFRHLFLTIPSLLTLIILSALFTVPPQRECYAKMAAEIPFNSLCSVCESVFACVRKDVESYFSWFHNVTELIHSAASGCHFCNKVLKEISNSDLIRLQAELDELQRENSGVVPRQLRAETRYYCNVGISFLLRRRDGKERDVLAAIELDLGDRSCR